MEQPSPSSISTLGQIIVTGPAASSLPLEHTSVSAQVTGPLASVTVTQRFGNPLQEPAELEYLFPLPHDSAVVDFELRIGARRIRGDVQEIEQARLAYEDAQRKGQRAGLLEQRRPNLFAVRLANVQVGETIQATLRYQQKTGFDDGSFEFVFPMGITPKYDRPRHPEEAEGVHAPTALPGEPIGTVEISVSVDAGMEVGEPVSPSHPIETVRLDERRFQVRLAGEHLPNKDFVLRYPLVTDQPAAGIWLSKGKGEETFLALLTPPALEEDYVPLRREFIFVFDRSGSMSVEPITQARNALRACLRTLRSEDTFALLLFDDRLEWYKPGSVPVTQAEIDQADAFLASVQSRGGTEIVGALEAALALPPDPERMRFVVFLTDGAVSAEQAALEAAQGKLGTARLFTFGIGSSVNRALLSRLAKIGKGSAEFLQLDEDIEGAIIRFQDQVTFPVLTDFYFEWQNTRAWDVFPTRFPDLFSGQPVEICGKLQRSEPGPVRLWVRGKRGKDEVSLQLSVPETTAAEPIVERVWASKRIGELLEAEDLNLRTPEQVRSEVIHLGLAHRLVTPYTAFVAIDEDVANPGGKAQKLLVAQPLPEGVIFERPEAYHLNAKLASFAPPPSSAPGMFRSLIQDSRMSLDNVEGNRPAPLFDEGPRFLRKPAVQPLERAGFSTPPSKASPDSGASTGQVLRWLARSQNLDGSWDADVERTAAALLAFVRSGQTTRTGSFREAVRRAFAWLDRAQAAGFAALVRAIALQELAKATGQPVHQKAAKRALSVAVQAMKSPTPNEQVLLKLAQTGDPGETMQCSEIKTLDDLRRAGLLRIKVPITEDLFEGPDAELAYTWSAVM